MLLLLDYVTIHLLYLHFNYYQKITTASLVWWYWFGIRQNGFPVLTNHHLLFSSINKSLNFFFKFLFEIWMLYLSWILRNFCWIVCYNKSISSWPAWTVKFTYFLFCYLSIIINIPVDFQDSSTMILTHSCN